MKDFEKKEDKNIIIGGIIAVILIIVLWIGTYFYLKDLCYDDRGTLGDMFGTVNSLYSGLALAGIILTVLLQRKELSYQREELRETRKEFVIQNKTLKAQRFENTFFNLLSLHNQIVNDIDYDKSVPSINSSLSNVIYETRTIKGRDVFKDAFSMISETIKEGEDFNEIYIKFYEKRKTDFGHYFRNLYRIIKMIDEIEFKSQDEIKLDFKNASEELVKKKYDEYNYDERYKYTCIVRAQLSDYELLLLFYNCLSDNGIKKFKPLVERYSLLKNIPKGEVSDEKLLNRYEYPAYGKKEQD